jgi:hypothetical protein
MRRFGRRESDRAEEHVSRDQHRADLAELRGELRDELGGLRQDVAVLAKTVEAGFGSMEQRFTQMEHRLDEQRHDIRGFQSTAQRQIWVLISVVTAAVPGGLIKLVFFP